MKKFLSLTLAMMMLATMLLGCATDPADTGDGDGGDDASGTTKDTVTMAVYSDFKTFDPMNSGMTLDKVVYQNVFDTLLNLYEGEYEKTLVTDYTVSEDGTQYTFMLKEGIKFHNGETLKASDVVFSLLRAKESTSHATATKQIADVTASDDMTVVVTLSEPYVPFLMAVAAAVPIMNEKATTEAGDQIGLTPIGTGAYTFVNFVAGQEAVLKAFPDCGTGTAKIENAIFKVIVDPSAALLAVETGEIDMTYSIPPVAVPDIEANEDLTYLPISTLGTCYVVYNLEKAPFDDVNFRLALQYAINPQEIIDVAVEGMAELSTGVWDSRYAGYSEGIDPYTPDIEKAKEYLEMSNYNGETIVYRAGYDNYKQIGIVMQEQLRQIGINMEVEQMEANAWVADMQSGNYDISFVGMTYDLDVDYFENIFGSQAIGAYNFSRLSRPEIDEAFAAGKSILDPAARAENYSVIQEILYEEAIIVPVYFRTNPCVYTNDLVVNRTYPLGFVELVDLEWK